MLPAEIQFARRLASSEKGVRDRAVRKLRQYLSVKTQSETGGFSQEELLKIWKGLFYCMWVQEEPLLQEELANTISQLIHVVNSSESQHLFIQTFWQTMNREWKGIDTLRLDKYYMLIRLVLRQSLEVLKRNGWEESQIKLFLDVLMKEILCPESQSPDGVRFHFIDIYLDELSKVGGKELLADQNLKFIDPFCKIVAKTKDHTLVQTIARGVLEVIVDQSPLVPEETVEEQKKRVGDGDLSTEELSEDEAARRAVSRKRAALGKSHCGRDGVGDERESKDCRSYEDTGLLLQFDYKAVAERLLEITNKKNIPPFNRKRLCKLIKKFQGLYEGNIPQIAFPEDIPADEDDQALHQGRHKKKRRKLLENADVEEGKGNRTFLAGEEDNEGSIQKRKRKKKKKSHPQPETWDPRDTASPPRPAQSGGVEPAAAQRQTPQVQAAEPRAGARPSSRESSLGRAPTILSHTRRKSLGVQGGPTGLPLEDSTPGGCRPQGPVARGCPAKGALVLRRKRKLGALPVNGSGQAPQTRLPLSPTEGEHGQATLPQCRRPEKKAEPSSLDLYNLPSQRTVLKKRKKMKEKSKGGNNGMLASEVTQAQALGSSRTVAPLKKQPLRTEKDFVKFDTQFLPKPLFFRKAKSSTTSPAEQAVQLNKTPISCKKVTFGLNRNMTAEFKKTDKSILVSPTGPSRVAFNPEQRPLHGVLKTPTSSPASTPLATTPKRRPTAMDFF